MYELDDDIPGGALDRALMLQNMVTSLATGGTLVDSIYLRIRATFLSDVTLKKLLPKFILNCRNGDGIWAYMKNVHSGGGAYGVRRLHINEEFAKLLDYLESSTNSPSDSGISNVIARYDAEGVQSAWTKALERRSLDPQGAITAARTLLEEVCKHILDDANQAYKEKWDLPKLYSEASKHLNLAPSQHTEEIFKKILGGCNSVVENLGSLRNKISDAHALGRKIGKPAPRHAALAVNLAGSMAMFLIETLLAGKQNAESSAD